MKKDKGSSRREFLKTVVISAGALQVAPLLGCGGGGGGGGTPDAGGNPDAGRPTYAFPHSVVSGDPRPTSIVLWTRGTSSAGGDVELTVERGDHRDVVRRRPGRHLFEEPEPLLGERRRDRRVYVELGHQRKCADGGGRAELARLAFDEFRLAGPRR